MSRNSLTSSAKSSSRTPLICLSSATMAKAMLTISSDITISRGSASAITSFVFSSRTSLMIMDWPVLCCNSSIQVLWVLPAGRIWTALASIYGSLFDCHKTNPRRRWSPPGQQPWRDPLFSLDSRELERLQNESESSKKGAAFLFIREKGALTHFYTWAFSLRELQA